jgi:hypothetical protein
MITLRVNATVSLKSMTNRRARWRGVTEVVLPPIAWTTVSATASGEAAAAGEGTNGTVTDLAERAAVRGVAWALGAGSKSSG